MLTDKVAVITGGGTGIAERVRSGWQKKAPMW